VHRPPAKPPVAGGSAPVARGPFGCLVCPIGSARFTIDRFGVVPDLPWTTRVEMEPGSGYLVMASHLPLKRISSTVRFFRGVTAVRRQLAAADGLVGYTLRAKPLARDYWTLSVWKDEGFLIGQAR